MRGGQLPESLQNSVFQVDGGRVILLAALDRSVASTVAIHVHCFVHILYFACSSATSWSYIA